MTARHFIADLHLGHAKIADLRGFASVEAHDEHLLDQLARIPDFDTIYVLGDMSSGHRDHEGTALGHLAANVSARMILIAGNHDSVSATHRRGGDRQRRWLRVFDSVSQYARIRAGGVDVLLSHYPYARSGDGPDRGPARYEQWRLPDLGAPLMHGHTHQSTPHMMRPTSRPQVGSGEHAAVAALPDLSQLCVSWDAHRGPISDGLVDAWIAAWIAQRDRCQDHYPTQHRASWSGGAT